MRKAAILLVLIMVISLVHVTGIADVNLTDINGHWAKSDIEYLIGLDVVDGYPDGTFRPNNTINADAFIKLIVTALGYTDIVNGTEYWASTYIDKAKELGIVLDGEFSNYTVEISRADMSRIISRALGQKGETFPEYLEAYKGLILDYDSLGTEYKTSVLENICAGLITGYPDGNFKPNGLATRAEGVTVIVRLIQEDRRKPAVFAEQDTEWEEWVNSEEASEFCTNEYFRALDGKIIYNTQLNWGEDESLVLASEVKDINKRAYELAKHFTLLAKENGHFIEIGYYTNWRGHESVAFRYLYSRVQLSGTSSYFEFKLYDGKLDVDGDYYYILNKLSALMSSFETSWDEYVENNYVMPHFYNAYRPAFDIIYGDKGQAIYDFVIEKFREDLSTQGESLYDLKTTIEGVKIFREDDDILGPLFWTTY
jgi:hypothetical protein